MKKVLSLLLAVVMIISAVSVFAANADMFELDEKGKVIKYTGPSSVHVPNNINGTKVKQISDDVFKGLDISSVFIDEGIISIGSGCFENSMASYIDVPSTMLLIGVDAFKNCTELSEITFRQDTLFIGQDALAGTGHLIINMPCTADEDSWKHVLKQAKGDNNFELKLIHKKQEIEEYDSFGSKMLKCVNCDHKTSRYPKNISEPFDDVTDSSWYHPNVATAYSLGIINGKSETSFDPDASMTLAEAAKIAACINASQRGFEDEFTSGGQHWYDTYVDYCYSNGIIDESVKFDWSKNATRAEMAYIFSRCDAKPVYINNLTLDNIPDVADSAFFGQDILNLYNRGIAGGSDDKRTFYPDSDVKRSEAAAFIARILCPDMRLTLK